MHDTRPLFSRQMLGAVYRLMEPARHLITPLLLLTALLQGLQLASPYIFKEILDALPSLATAGAGRVLWLIALATFLSVVTSCCKVRRDRVLFGFLLTLERHLPVQAQAKLMDLSLGYHEDHDTGNTVVKVQRGTDRYVDLLANALFDFLPTLMQTVVTFVLLLVVEWRIALVFAACIPPFVWITYWMNRRVRPLRTKRFEGYEQAGGQMTQSLINIHTVLSFAQGKREVNDHARIRQEIFDTESREWRFLITCNFWRDTLINAGRAAVLLFSVLLFLRHETTLGSLVLFMSWSETAYVSLFRISRMFDRAAEWTEAVHRLTALLDATTPVADGPAARKAPILTGAISFHHVSYGYTRYGREALRDVSLSIESGSTVAFVGPSGCGKTTAVKLLFRHYLPTRGAVLLDGQDVARLGAESFRRQMAIVPQEVEIFNATVRENIAYAQPGAPKEKILEAARLANADAFILDLPQGYDTLVGERGMKLSGGQRQRLGIARALLPNPRILVFDEATSSLDSESEELIQRSMRTICAGRTTILIAHRLSTVRDADRIFVFDRGCIREAGTHQELLARGGLYHRLHRIQMRSAPSVPSLNPLTIV